MKLARTIEELRAALEPPRPGVEVGLVPTMGAFHDGHRALFRAAREECGTVVASLFVNPAQFGPGEGLDGYPRDEARDVRVAEEVGVDLLFVPAAAELYPEGFGTWVEVEELSRTLEGRFRPGHFRGVATVCLKLFHLVAPRRAYFGRKDVQQLSIVRKLVSDLNVPVEIRAVETVRDANGLALSSRNVQLDTGERVSALALSRALAAGAAAHRAGDDPVTAARAVLAGEPGVEPQYLEIARFDGQAVLALAARVGTTRLIDNVLLEGDEP